MRKLTRASAPLLLILAVCGCARYAGTSEDVTFTSRDGIELRGSLVLPAETTSRLPVVVLLHGSEPATRSLAYRLHANVFLERGMAVLLYDKRGAGASGGDHDSASYAQFIDDALAAIGFLRQRPEIDPDRIGVVGASESGWFTPEIAERAGNLAFVINKSGSSVSWQETVAWETYNDLVTDGVGPDSAREQTAVSRRLWAYYVSPSDDERGALEATLREWAAREDSQLPVAPRAVSPSYVQDIAYDPAPFLERLTTPTFYVFGSEDVNIPTVPCVERLTELRDAGRPVSFHVFDGEGHELGGIGVLGYQFVGGYADLLGDFAERHVRQDASTPAE